MTLTPLTTDAPIAAAAPRLIQLLKYGIQYPDGSHRVLTTPAAEVTAFDDRLRQLVVDMFHTMYAHHGVGLAATQFGLGLRVAVVDVSLGKNPAAKIVLVNPVVIESSGSHRGMEGCLSLPGFQAGVDRPTACRVRAQDERGDWSDIMGHGLLARALVHETDHCNGLLYIDCISGLRRTMIQGKVKKLIRQGKW